MKLPLPEPLDLPWSFKSLSSAETQVETLENGQLRLWVRHEVLKGVTPEMLVWWFKNLEESGEIEGKSYPHYRIWHYRDHQQSQYLKRCSDGTIGPGAVIRFDEVFGRDPEFAVSSTTQITKLDESGFSHYPVLAGIRVAKADCFFQAVSGGTLYENSLVVGFTGPFRFLNKLLIPKMFSDKKAHAWLKHNVEEVGSFEHFLPKLYAGS